MKIAVIIPDRGDRPEFLANCLRMIEAQTLKPVHVELVNDAPLNDQCDITYRYRTGYDRLRGKGFDLIAFLENDDWYSPEYLQVMSTHWENVGKPDLIGNSYTIYYHLGLKKWRVMEHMQRSSAMNTLIKPDLEIPWCPDYEAYTDIHLWMKAGLKGIVFKPSKHIAIGMKHGVGLTGGGFHTTKLGKYAFDDSDMSFLRSNLDAVSFDFYSKMIRHLNERFVPVVG